MCFQSLKGSCRFHGLPFCYLEIEQMRLKSQQQHMRVSAQLTYTGAVSLKEQFVNRGLHHVPWSKQSGVDAF
ncbi:hypothetical protein DUNSADRAFT_1817 [Dunaliella salina]|uniref:Encoded protein n=1 Tax=Dunaliella salina TaxID=3046 RepID=A0ABQ7FX05_DUNSA|nr:hypothetical protein DUNSADRAFT_1817 [Dunaliella salina]|eukprot:KAF5826884.1 hypothetical protein DUNSADRAFT_1817 [Dunaliella salina]